MKQTITRSPVLSVLRHRPFRLFWGGNLISGCGIWMQNLAVGWLIARLPHGAFLLGLYGFVTLIPILLFSIVGGTIADKFNRRGVLLCTQSILMILALGLAWLTHMQRAGPGALIGVAAMTGVVVAINAPAYQAIIPDLVPVEDLSRAIGLNSVQFNIARIVGHAIAGLMVASVGAALCFLLNGLSYLPMLYAVFMIPAHLGSPSVNRTPFLNRLHEGIKYVRHEADILRWILLVGCISLFGLPYFFLLPKFASDVLGVSARGLGYLTASVSVGGLIGGFAMPLATRRISRITVVTAASFLFWGCLFGFAISKSYWLSLLLLTVMGASLVLTLATINNMLQVKSPSDMRGRVMSVYGIAANGMAPLGSVAAGAIASVWSVSRAVAILAATGVVVTAALRWGRRAHQKIAMNCLL